MKKLLITCLIGFYIGSVFSQNTLSNEDKIYGLSTVWKEVDSNFPFIKEKKLNWDSLYYSSIYRILQTKSDYDYYQQLKFFIGQLHEGHTDVVSPYKLSNSGVIDLAVRYIQNNFYIIGIGKSLENKVKLGSKIETINGIPAKEYVDSMFYPYHNYSKRIVYSIAANSIFYGKLNEILVVKLIDLNDNEYVIKQNRKEKYGEWKSFKTILKRKPFIYKKIERTAYIKIGTFSTYNVVKEFYKHIDSIKNCDNIIFDIRNNFGGSSYGELIARYFISDSIFVNKVELTRENNARYIALGCFNDTNIRKIIRSRRNLDYYKKYLDYYLGTKYDTIVHRTNNVEIAGLFSKKKVIFLINNLTASAAESFLLTMLQNNVGITIGESTFGSTCQPIFVTLPGGGYVKIASTIPILKNGKLFNYFKPDICVSPTINDYIKNYDRVLDRAIKYLKK